MRLQRMGSQAAIFTAILTAWQATSWLFPGFLGIGPLEVWRSVSNDAEKYLVFAGQVGVVAAQALLISVGAGFLLASITQVFPAALVLSRPLLFACYSVPLVGLIPLLTNAGNEALSRSLVLSLLCFYPIFEGFVRGMQSTPRDLLEMSHFYGARRVRELWLLRLRAGIPVSLVGVQAAFPSAVLAVMLLEIMSGRGFGEFLIGAMMSADAERILSATLVLTLAASMGFYFLGRIALAANRMLKTRYTGPNHSLQAGKATLPQYAWSLVILVLVWALVNEALLLPDYYDGGPRRVFGWLSAGRLPEILPAVWESLGVAVLGLCLGLAFAVLAACIVHIVPRLQSAATPLLLLSQATPIVALIPMITLVLGRSDAAVVAISVSVVFLPAYAVVYSGLEDTPSGVDELASFYGVGRWRRLFLVSSRYAVPYSLAAMRLTSPRVLAGVVLGEYLVTSKGLGGVIRDSYLEPDTLWTVLFMSLLASFLIHQSSHFLSGFLVSRRMEISLG